MIVDSQLAVRREPPKFSGIFQTHKYRHGELQDQLSANAFSIDYKTKKKRKIRNEEKQIEKKRQ